MLWNASALNGYPIKANDGQVGTVAGLIYDPSDWAVRWLVADTGDWLSRRQALLPISALGQPDPESHLLPVNLTMRQVEDCPDIDTSKPLSPATETLFRNHYNISPGPGRLPGNDAIALAPLQILPVVSVARDTNGQGPLLNSLSDITGISIEATDGDVGHSEDFLIDTALWQVRYLTVHSSRWWTGETRLISPQSIEWVDWARSIIHLNVTCQKVKNSPPYVAADTADGAFEELFDTYYGIRWVRR